MIPSFGSGKKDDKGKDGKEGETVSADNPKDWDKIKHFYRRKRKKH